MWKHHLQVPISWIPLNNGRPLTAIHHATTPRQEDLLVAVRLCIDHDDSCPVRVALDRDKRAVENRSASRAELENVRLVGWSVASRDCDPGGIDPL
jgi:hypothetical protein